MTRTLGFTEIHSHFVYGVDDGARSRTDMERMLDAAYENGVTTLYATPHVTPALRQFDWEVYDRHLDMARAYCQRMEYGMTLHAGAEVLYTPAMAQHISDRRLPTLAESDHVLMELVPDMSFKEIESALHQMERAGYMTILAHIERYDALMRGKNAQNLKENHNVLYQVNAGSVIKRSGFFRERRIRSWFHEELIDFIASDAHDCSKRPYCIRAAHETLKQYCDERYVKELTCGKCLPHA